jgi:chitinase
VCYWGTWAVYRPGGGKFSPADIDASLCTHLVYSFAGIDNATSTIKSLDEWMDLVPLLSLIQLQINKS